MSIAETSDGKGLQAQGLSCARGGHQVLHGVDLSVGQGQIVGLVGANGAGKTTLFDVICGLRAASAGRVGGSIPADRIAYLTQSITVPDALRLGELAELIFGVAGLDGARAQVNHLLGEREMAKFAMLWNRRSNSCSYGEKRWFVLMVVLSMDADLFILDEPSNGVDIEYRHYVWQAVRQIKQQGKSVIFSTHVASEIEDVCDHFYFLKQGRAELFESTQVFLSTTQTQTLDAGFVAYLSDQPAAA